MDKDISATLKNETPGPAHDALLARVRSLVEMSRTRMNSYYPDWDRYDDVYRGIRPADKQDKKAAERKEPTKLVVPIAHAQIQTFVAFCYSVLFQREYFFELTPYGADNSKAAAIGEALIQRDLDHFNFPSTTYQFLLDAARFGVGIFKDTWVEELQWVTEETPANTVSLFGATLSYGSKSARVQKPKYQGNKVINVSPYRFFPDPRLPIRRFQEGEFVASEDEYSYQDLKQMEAEGSVQGIDFIGNLNKDTSSEGRKTSRMTSVDFSDTNRDKPLMETKGNVIVTEVQLKLIPSKTMIDEKTPLGEEDSPVKYLVWYANDNRIIRIEPLNYVHDQFTYSVGEFSPDLHHFINDGLSGVIDSLQDVITWFINSHITSVRKVIQNQLVVDPQGVNMDDIRERRSVIRLKEGMSRMGVERWVHQLEVSDVTSGHMENAAQLEQLVQIVTGINDNALGQFNGGRRSATEAKNVNTGMSSRLKMHISLIYYSAFVPLGRRMLSNLRDGLTLETYVRIFGVMSDPTLGAFDEFAKATKEQLTGDYDFEMFDGTLPSEKQYQAQTLTELITELSANPQMAMMLGFDIKKLILETLRLRGIRNPEQFMMDQVQQQTIMQAMLGAQGQQNGPGQTSGSGQPAQGALGGAAAGTA